MKGVALANLRLESTLASQPQQNNPLRDPSNLNKLSMLEFYKALEINPNSVLALNGMGLGFGNAVEAVEGFGILSMASICPIVSVLITGLWVQRGSSAEKSAA